MFKITVIFLVFLRTFVWVKVASQKGKTKRIVLPYKKGAAKKQDFEKQQISLEFCTTILTYFEGVKCKENLMANLDIKQLKKQ
jgi:hypothetical protein